MKHRVRALAFNVDGTLLASGSTDRTICLWDAATGDLLKTLQGHTDGIWSLAFHPTNPVLASGGIDHVVHLSSMA